MKHFMAFLLVVFISLQSLARNKQVESDGYGKENYGTSLKCNLVNGEYNAQQNLLPDSLNKYVGGYFLSGQVIKVYLKANTIMALIPGQPEYTLLYTKENEFAVKDAPGFIVQFETDNNGDVTGFTLIQPDGKVKAKKVSGENNVSAIPVQLTKEQLEKYAGDYSLSGNPLKIYLKENILMAKISAQQDYELVSLSESDFNVKGVSGFSVQFQKDKKGKVTECIITQPGGTVIAKRVSK